MTDIIQLLCEKVNASTDDPSSQTSAKPPVSVTEMQAIEAKIGYTLPNLLRHMYLEIGNGYFSERFRLLAIEDFFIVHTKKNKKYLIAGEDDSIGLTYLGIKHWGCHIYSCIDLSNPPYPVLTYDAVGSLFIPEKSSFEEWMLAWMNGEHLWDAIMEDQMYDTFVSVLTSTQNINTPLLRVLAEWIDELLIEKS
jgi:hypothetical protein